MKKKFFEIDCKWKEYAAAGCVCVLFAAIVFNLGKILGYAGTFLGFFRSIFLGAIFAYIINPFAVFLAKKVLKHIKSETLRWILSVVISLIIVLALITGLMFSIIPQFIESITNFVNNSGSLIATIADIADKIGYGDVFKDYTEQITGENGLLQKSVNYLAANLDRILKTTSNISSAATTWLIGFIFAIYFLISKKYILASFGEFFSLVLSKLNFIRGCMFLAKFNSIFSKYIVCEILDSVIVGVATFIFMAACGMPNAVLISVVCGVTNLAPTFGPIVGAVIGTLFLVLVDVHSILPFLIFTIVLQTADGYVIKPKLFGGALNVPGVLILIAIIVFGKLFGVAGMLIAIPVAAIYVYFYDEVLIPYLKMKKELHEYKKENQQEKSNG